jgi:hypothetical protein
MQVGAIEAAADQRCKMPGNQVLGERTSSRSELANEEPPRYISCYINGYGRP